MEDKINALQYVNFVRQQKCCICFNPPPNDPDHLDQIGMGRKRQDPSLLEHFSCIPLCRKHHSERHTMPIKQFEEIHNCNLWWEIYDCFTNYIIALRKGEL